VQVQVLVREHVHEGLDLAQLRGRAGSACSSASRLANTGRQ
jgi:hypothetical protein